MNRRRPKVAVIGTRFHDFEVERQVLGEVELTSGPGGSQAEILEIAADADVILAGAAPVFDAETLESLQCRGIVRLGVGVDGVDLEKARSLGMWVANVPDYGTEAVALHTVTLVLSSLRRLTRADRRLREGSWGVAELRPLHLPSSLTLGVVGFGRIGQRVATMLDAIGFERCLVTDPFVGADTLEAALPGSDSRLVELADLLADADVVTLHAPPPPHGHLLGQDQLAMMKEGAILVNTARGALVDSAALVPALTAGRPGFAALDVFEREPPDVSLFQGVADQMILTPHMSWYTEESELSLRRQAAEEARLILDSKAPLNAIVSPPAVEAR